MSEENFTASVQYDDFTGTVAADNADQGSLSSWLRDEELTEENEFLIGVEMYSGDSFLEDENSAWVGLLLQNSDDNTIRKIRVDMSLEDFFSFFKRFEIKISRDGQLTDEEIIVEEILELSESD